MLSQYPDLPENHTLDLLGEERERERDENKRAFMVVIT